MHRPLAFLARWPHPPGTSMWCCPHVRLGTWTLLGVLSMLAQLPSSDCPDLHEVSHTGLRCQLDRQTALNNRILLSQLVLSGSTAWEENAPNEQMGEVLLAVYNLHFCLNCWSEHKGDVPVQGTSPSQDYEFRSGAAASISTCFFMNCTEKQVYKNKNSHKI